MTVSSADVRAAREAAQHALHQARAEKLANPKRDFWRGQAYKLARVVLKLCEQNDTATPAATQPTTNR